ncbi:MAG: hypothetical protein AAGF12_31470, partial [Myxococcota bacterium]
MSTESAPDPDRLSGVTLALRESFAEEEGKAPDLGAMLAEIKGKVDKERGVLAWLRSRPTWLRGLIAVSVLALYPILDVVLRPRPDLEVYPAERLWMTFAALGLVGFAVALSSLRPLHRPPLPKALRWSLLAAAVLVPIIVAALPQAHAAHPAAIGGVGSELIPKAGTCFSFGAVVALPLFFLIRALDRGTSTLAIVLGAGAAGVGANLLLQNHCCITHPSHLLVGHASIAVLYVGIALIAVTFRRKG